MAFVLTEREARRIAAKFAPDASQVSILCRRANDPEYWMALNPASSVGASTPVDWCAEGPRSDAGVEEALANYRAHGFLRVTSALSAARAARMRAVIERLRVEDWPAVFAFVYDDFWSIAQSPLVRALLTTLLGAEYRMRPGIWAHYVYPGPGNGGWAPHLDGRKDCPLTISAWIPLSSATVGNGCMYVVKRTPETERLCRDYHATDMFSRKSVDTLLRNARALPAEPGDLLCWDQQILHWGSPWDAGATARVSLALEFSAPAEWTSADAARLVNPFSAPPALAERLALIGSAILKYEPFEPFAARFAPLARMLCSSTSAE